MRFSHYLRCIQSIFDRPTFAKAVSNHFTINSKLSRNRSKTGGFTSECNDPQSRSILGLLFSGCPSAISWFIISFLVWVSIKCRSVRSFSHILQEILERVFPSIANDDSESTVNGKLCRFRIKATILHGLPRFVCSCWRFSAIRLSEGFLNGEYWIRHNFVLRTLLCLASNGRLATAIGAVLILPPFLGSYKEIQ